MRKLPAVLCIAAFAVLLFSGSALATFISSVGGGNGSESSLQNILDDITVNPDAPYDDPSSIYDSSVDASGDDNDALDDLADSYWSITATGGSVTTFIIEIAGYAGSNSLGIYDAGNVGSYVSIFSGSATAGAQATVSIMLDGSVTVNGSDTGVSFSGYNFGYYLDSPDGWFYSDTALNSDDFDHMVAFQGNDTDMVQIANYAPGLWTDNEFILAWEDLEDGGDQDYNDLVVMVESVINHPVPEPATMLLLGTGLIGLAAFRRRTMG